MSNELRGAQRNLKMKGESIMKHILATVLVIGAIGTVSAHAGDFNGVWQTTFGEVRVQERSGSFCGEYGTTGFVAGYTNGTFARGVFVHADQSTGKLANKNLNEGLFQWVQAADGKFNGNWLWGTDVKFSNSEPWNGTRKSKTRPSGASWRRNAGFCLSYLASVPKDTANWMRAVLDIAPYPDAPGDASSSGANSNSNTTPATPIPSHVNVRGLQQANECHMSSNNKNLLVCSGNGWRHVLDLSLCSRGTVAMKPVSEGGQLTLSCHAQVSGSYIQSCDPMMIYGSKSSANPAQTTSYYSTRCAGPKLNMVGSGDSSKVLVRSNTRYVRYERRGGDRRYVNDYAASACRAASFWNENGNLRCSN
jgi:hypothetical protein